MDFSKQTFGNKHVICIRTLQLEPHSYYIQNVLATVYYIRFECVKHIIVIYE